jgi:spermidine synthase
MLHEGNVQGSLAHHEQALRIKPDSAEVQNNLAWALATLPPAEGGEPVRAVTLAERACKLTGSQMPAYLDTLAAAYAAAGRFKDAIVTAQKGIELARSAGQPQVVSEIEGHLQLYRDGRAYRQLPTPVENQSIN